MKIAFLEKVMFLILHFAYNIETMIINQEDANVITVDWETGANMWNYFQAVSNTKVVGAEITW